MEDIWGYKVEKLESKNCAYRFTGPRGGIKLLVRHVNNPELMFVTGKYGTIENIKGNYTWSDDGGDLRPIYGGVL